MGFARALPILRFARRANVSQPIAARIPAAAPYSYAVIGDRVYLVDPATSLIVAAITP